MLELRDSGIKVSVVNPGSVATDFGPAVGEELDVVGRSRRRAVA